MPKITTQVDMHYNGQSMEHKKRYVVEFLFGDKIFKGQVEEQ